MIKKTLAIIFSINFLLGCATIHRHPKITTVLVGAVAGGVIGGVLGHQTQCKSYYNSVPYNGTPPCPVYCDSPGHCDWPKK